MDDNLLENFARIFLVTAGISRNANGELWERVFSCFVTLIYIIQVTGNYIGYVSFDLNIEQIIEMVFRLIGHTYVLFIHWFIKLHKKSVLKITSSLCGRRTPDFVGDEAIIIMQRSFKLIGTVTLTVYSATMLTYMLVSIVVGVATNLQADEVYIYLFPYWYTCKGGTGTIRYTFLCWNVASYRSYLLKNGCQFALMFVEQMSLFNCVALFVLLMLYFEAHTEVLKNRTKDLKRRTDDIFKLYCRPVRDIISSDQIKTMHEKTFNRGVVEFVKYHQFLRKYVKFEHFIG